VFGKREQTKPSFNTTPFDAHVTAQMQNKDTGMVQNLFLSEHMLINQSRSDYNI
jgi:hypothetical protein